MSAYFKHFFAPPIFADDEKTRTAGLLNILLLVCIAGLIPYLLLAIGPAPDQMVRLRLGLGGVVVFSLLLLLMRRGYVRLASGLFAALLWLGFALSSVLLHGLQDPGFSALLIIIPIAGLLLNTKLAMLAAVFDLALGVVLLVGESSQILPVFHTAAPNRLAFWFSNCFMFLLAACLLYCANRNITDALNQARASEESLRRSNRAYRILSECNETLTRATDEITLLADICRIVVEEGDTCLAWVGFADERDGQMICPIAQAGHLNSYLDSIHEIGSDCDPTLEALRTGEIRILQQIHDRQCPAALLHDFNAVIALPLKINQRVIGTLSVYSPRSDAFDSDGIELLTELAGDIAYGIQALRTRAEHERISLVLAEQYQLLRTVIDNIPDVIFLKDIQGRYEVVNRTYADNAGKSLEEVIGKTAFDLYPPEEACALHETDMQYIRENKPVTLLVSRIRRATGEPRWVLESLVPVRDSSGKTTRLLGIAHDMTERIQMEDQLRYQANLLENVSDAIVSINLNSIILSWNAAAENVYGVPASAAIGRQLGEIFTTEFEGTSTEQALQDVMTAGTWKGEVVQKTPAGRILHIQAATSVIHDNQGTVIGLVSVNRDITDQKLAEQALAEREHLQQELQHAQELSETRNRFVSMVSHEFRTPLTVIEMSTDMIERYWERMGPEKQQTHLRNIRSMVKRLDGLLADFTLVMRAESGHLIFKPSLIDVEQQVRQLIDEFRGALTEKHTITYSAEGVSNEVMGDPVLLGYIVRNLISNAIKYSPDGGEVRIELSQIGSQITLKVQDQGIGIPPDDVERLFDAYQRAGNVGQIRGTGLGLKIVKDCVKLHGGHIEVSSELNRGTTFIVTLETA